MVNKLPQCVHCFGQNWQQVTLLNKETGLFLYQCGGCPADSEPENAKNGCYRVITTTEERMAKGGVI